jgi:excisionase family DNA binding protein
MGRLRPPVRSKNRKNLMGGNRSYSTRQLAGLLGVSVQTVQRWADAGYVKAWKTPSGHRKIDAASADALIEEMRASGGKAPKPEPQRVLIVDDDPAALSVVELLVEETLPSTSITRAENGFQALQAIGRSTPDILVTDIVMPHIDGLAMLKHVATQASRPALVIVTTFLSADELDEAGGLPPGVTYLPKPIDQDAFKTLLRMHVAVP